MYVSQPEADHPEGENPVAGSEDTPGRFYFIWRLRINYLIIFVWY